MSINKETKEVITYLSLIIMTMIVLIVIIVFPIFWGKSYMEAKTFNKLTGSDATTWDAMWVQLRVMEPIANHIVKE